MQTTVGLLLDNFLDVLVARTIQSSTMSSMSSIINNSIQPTTNTSPILVHTHNLYDN